jgi:DNA-binding IclR family transcriptional regulator
MAPRPIKTTKTIFDIIETIQKHDGAGVTEVSESIGRAPSTVYEHMMTLEEMAYLRKEGEQYHLGLRFLDHGIYAKERVPVVGASHPALEQLVEDTGENAWIIVEEHGWAINLEGAAGDRGIRTGERIGWRTYLHVHAAGKAILAFLPESRSNEIIEERGLPALTENTITDADELFAELEEIRDRGYAFDRGEGIEGLSAVAAPIVVDGTVHGSVTVYGPTNRMRGERFRQEIPDQVLGAANAIELQLAHE